MGPYFIWDSWDQTTCTSPRSKQHLVQPEPNFMSDSWRLLEGGHETMTDNARFMGQLEKVTGKKRI